MDSSRNQEKRKDTGDDFIPLVPSKRHRGNDLDPQGAFPSERDERLNHQDGRDLNSKPRKGHSNPQIQRLKSHKISHPRRDVRVSSTGRASAKQNRPRELDLPSAGELRNRIRDIKRLLKRADHLPPGVKIEKERALIGYERDLEIVESRKNRAAMIKKYHFVRFLERKTATRQLAKLIKQKKSLTESNPNKQELDALEKLIYITEVDLNYAIYSPLTEKYISLYPNQHRDKQSVPEQENPKITVNNSGEKPPLWYAVEQSMKDGTLDLLREGRLKIDISGQKKTAKNLSLPVMGRENEPSKRALSTAETDIKKFGKKTKKEKNKEVFSKHSKMDVDIARDDNDDDDDSDGGFFEE
ncbi:hypothetical protein PABG_02931 [Paracoccidioides brasiliensis Pb03]|nr:hypothetical protein PABG_02931 [Paracoccidioides brasiliensis Pb03]